MRTIEVKWSSMPRVLKYEVQYRKIGDPTWSESEYLTINQIQSLLEEGTSYQFRVRSICIKGISDWSYLGVNVYTNDAGCPSPSDITFEQVPDSFNYIISWAGNNNAKSWNLRYRMEGSLLWTIVSSNAPSVILSNLVIGATYVFQVQTVCNVNTSSNWGTEQTINIYDQSGVQGCPVDFEEEWSIVQSVAGRKDYSNTVTLSGIVRYSEDNTPEEGDYLLVGSVGLCCAPQADFTIRISQLTFKGELTVNTSGQIILLVQSITAAIPVNIDFSGISYRAISGTCPPVITTPVNIEGTISFTLSSASNGGKMTMSLEFTNPTQAGISFDWGYCVHNNTIPQVDQYCFGFIGASHDSSAAQKTSTVIGAGSSSFIQQSSNTTLGSGYGYIVSIYIYNLIGIDKANIHLAEGQNYQLIFL